MNKDRTYEMACSLLKQMNDDWQYAAEYLGVNCKVSAKMRRTIDIAQKLTCLMAPEPILPESEDADRTDAPDVQEEDSEETKDAGRVHEDGLD
jgi:hypothetical protein